jgi:predicted nucleic acid-binding protein
VTSGNVDPGVLDTSVFVAGESGRPLGRLPDEAAISAITVAELYLGVLMADDPDVRATRLATLNAVERRFDPLPVDDAVAHVFAELVARARRLGRRPKVPNVLIAATAVAHRMPVYTQDEDFAAIPGVAVIRV